MQIMLCPSDYWDLLTTYTLIKNALLPPKVFRLMLHSKRTITWIGNVVKKWWIFHLLNNHFSRELSHRTEMQAITKPAPQPTCVAAHSQHALLHTASTCCCTPPARVAAHSQHVLLHTASTCCCTQPTCVAAHSQYVLLHTASTCCCTITVTMLLFIIKPHVATA